MNQRKTYPSGNYVTALCAIFETFLGAVAGSLAVATALIVVAIGFVAAACESLRLKLHSWRRNKHVDLRADAAVAGIKQHGGIEL